MVKTRAVNHSLIITILYNSMVIYQQGTLTHLLNLNIHSRNRVLIMNINLLWIAVFLLMLTDVTRSYRNINSKRRHRDRAIKKRKERFRS